MRAEEQVTDTFLVALSCFFVFLFFSSYLFFFLFCLFVCMKFAYAILTLLNQP